ncbi:hypothetical protein RR46_06287 [Papilio xuthus]|uniref:Uncharacterized protein n=1 Tax=Papilio xuthus TaxID=66420 RepID=A0A194QCI4_PAPXU|nr:hypothetical protein RR46_06287 [Papilio xuthus]
MRHGDGAHRRRSRVHLGPSVVCSYVTRCFSRLVFTAVGRRRRANVACPHCASIRSAQRTLLPPGPAPAARAPPRALAALRAPRPGAGLCRAPPARSPVSHVLSRKAAASRATRFAPRAIL